MRIVCPKCELKGHVDVSSGSAKTRIACVRCVTTFDAVFADGRIQALLPQASHTEMALATVANNDESNAETKALVPFEPEQEATHDFAQQLESAPLLADDFSASSMNAAPEEISESPWSAWPREPAKDFSWPSADAEEPETPGGMQAESVFETPLEAVVAGKAAEPSDAYGLGVRLMRVSPMWLLLAGLSFISFIVLCNWLIKPDDRTGDASRMLLAADNHATNQSSSRIVAPNSTALAPVNSQIAQPTPQPAVSFIPAEAKEETAPKASAPSVETIEKPAVEEKAAMPAPPLNGAGEAKAGKVTIQIGSYNEAAQAEERVANLKSAGYEAQSVPVEIPKRGTWYRVQSGHFVSRDEAERYGKQLRDKGVVSSFITTDVQE
jgi:cell division septation protein DedD